MYTPISMVTLSVKNKNDETCTLVITPGNRRRPWTTHAPGGVMPDGREYWEAPTWEVSISRAVVVLNELALGD